MKCIEIAIGNSYPTDVRTMSQFVECEEAQTPFGQLTIALTREIGWSAKYHFSTHFHKEGPYLLIGHALFPPPGTMVFGTDSGEDVSVHGVENAVRSHFYKLHEELQPGIAALQLRANDLNETAMQIVVEKARAAVVASFPEAGELEYLPFSEAWRALYVFGRSGDGYLYVARTSDNEVTRGVTRIESSILAWSGMGDIERHELFWTELARTYIVRELQIPESRLPRYGNVSAKEKPLSSRIHSQLEDGYEDVEVTFRAETVTGESRDVIVEFGLDNLPAKAYLAEPVVGLIDMAAS